MRTIKSGNKLAVLFFGALLLKYLLYGFSYYPVLDDFIQYGGYPLYGDLGYVWFGIGTMTSRPLASLLDPLLWGSLWEVMGVSLFLITMLHFSAVCFLERTLYKNGYSVGPLFWIASLFLPIASEGAYWISASSRLVVGLFFASASLYFLTRALSEKKAGFTALFIVLHLLSYGFYEAVAVFSFLCAVFILYHRRKSLGKRVWFCAVPVLCLISMFLYTLLAANIGAMGSRAGGFGFSNLVGKIGESAWQLGRIFTKGVWKSTVGGFFSGLKVLGAEGLWGALVLLLILAASVVLARFGRGKRSKSGLPWGVLVVGALLFLAPLAPNILVETVWFPYRSIFVSLIGLALALDTLVSRIRVKPYLKYIAYAAVLFVCLVANVNEYDTYKRVSEYDVRTVQNIAERLDSRVLSGERNAIVIVEAPTEIAQVDCYKDHVKSVLEQDWSLTGAVRAVTKNMKIKLVTPVFSGEGETTNEQVLFLGADGHITQIRESLK
ncbi:MAG: hypothetical protein IJB48_02440 [Clostridia bacterium]|nr:hypothetical protein [Clostridia bacterium]